MRLPQENAYTQPRLVLDEDIIWLPVPAASTEVTVGSAKKYRKHNDIGNAGRFWTDMDTAQASASHSKVAHVSASHSQVAQDSASHPKVAHVSASHSKVAHV